MLEGCKRYINRVIAAEISAFSRYYDALIQWRPRPEDSFTLFDSIACPSKRKVSERTEFPDLSSEKESRTLILLNGNFNFDTDIQQTLLEFKPRLSRTSRIVVVAYNPYFKPIYKLANRLGIRRGEEPKTFITRTDLQSIARLSGFELVRMLPVVYSPARFLGIGSLINKVLPSVPFFRWFCLAAVMVLRPVIPENTRPSLSIIVPARNERGNIEPLLSALQELKDIPIELIFVEGHSSDGTWEEIQRLLPAYSSDFPIRAFRQAGTGKADAVRTGCSEAGSDLMTILDADMTMPVEMLERFYRAYASGLADFINGNRRVYPMEREAMRHLNRIGNLFFTKALCSVLGVRLGDTLCGTKLLSRHDYRRFRRWQADFGDFDPFGDFELLFPAAVLALDIVDVPIQYRARTYGKTQIKRFSNGLTLLRMTLIGLWRVKFGKLP